MERIDAVCRELDDTENSPEQTGQAEANLNTQEEQMLAVVQEDPEVPEPTPPENGQGEGDSRSNEGARNQPEVSRTAAVSTSTPVQRLEALKVLLTSYIRHVLEGRGLFWW